MTDFMSEDTNIPEWRGYGIGLLYFLACFVQPYFSNSMYHIVSKVRAFSLKISNGSEMLVTMPLIYSTKLESIYEFS